RDPRRWNITDLLNSMPARTPAEGREGGKRPAGAGGRPPGRNYTPEGTRPAAVGQRKSERGARPRKAGQPGGAHPPEGTGGSAGRRPGPTLCCLRPGGAFQYRLGGRGGRPAARTPEASMASDMVVALARATAGGQTLFGHNSNAPGGLPPSLARLPGRAFAPGEKVRATYLELPQVRQTHAA